MPTVLLGVTGCIAAYKSCEILRELQRRGAEVRVVMTRHAKRFVGPTTFEALSGHEVYIDPFRRAGGAEMPHVRWPLEADLLLVAPATANVVGKMAHGIADDALTTLHLATRAPIVVAPAMNVEMWAHPAVVANIGLLRQRGVLVVEPEEGYLACGATGGGRLADVQRIVDAAMGRMAGRRDLVGLHVLVTGGPTREAIDAVRFISNRSSGRMGIRLAEAARDRGAEVDLVLGPTTLPDPWGIACQRVESAEEMAEAVRARAGRADVVVLAAAVSDHRPAARAAGKLKKGSMPGSLDLLRTPDIARELGVSKGRRTLVGFAAETEDLVANARRKLEEKRLDLIVANDVSAGDVGFDVETNAAVLIEPTGDGETVERTSKRGLAERIWDRVVALRAAGGSEGAP